ncbi:hypothetical protein A3L04_01775 [Thermococcus chitonophagus]|uniref:Phosphatidate cytidylyltransferase n=1 Tax=Thermococcus chitonophagus TaxID=54262 RepID=A0A160VQX2_9EURY|nr:hypothetical protein [Thermococcus chitonophagus]ASJ15890.1 hypothetical protein A3L04_01775 [Thermococcus chitonophagus]CUX77130.1 hypothetical protein CHITON_0351 [Thermococcus chitonophagus]
MSWVHVGIALASILIAITITKNLGEEYAWVNRKIIHFSIVPAILMMYLGLIEAKIFSTFAFTFAVGQLSFHVLRKEFEWFQIPGNYGEVFFAFSAGAIALLLDQKYATALLLVMAISDGVTGVIRFFYFRKKGFNVKLRKHWTGSLGFFLASLIIAVAFLEVTSIAKIAWALVLTLAEYQPWLDDNLAVPLAGGVLSLIL